MKTKAFFKKELQECWAIGAWAAGLMLVAGIVLLRINFVNLSQWSFGNSYMAGWRMFVSSHPRNFAGSLSGFTPLLMGGIGLGIALAIRQFLVPFYTGEWAFLIHRPVQRHRLLLVKVWVAGLLSLPLVLIWLGCWLIAHFSTWYPAPVPLRSLGLGFVLLIWTAVAYCAVADSVLLRHIKRWRWIKAAAPLAAIIFFFGNMYTTAPGTVAFQLLLLALFSLSILGTFLNREF